MTRENAFPEHPSCAWCQDSGIVFHEIWVPTPFRWCEAAQCTAATTRRKHEPNAVDESNRAYVKLGLKP